MIRQRFSAFFRQATLVGLAIIMLATVAQADGPKKLPKASAMVVTVKVANYSGTCAWVTIYWSRPLYPWTIEGSTNGRPRFVHPGGYFDFKVLFTNPLEVPIPAEIKVRSEFTRNKDCSGGTIADREAYNKMILADSGSLGFFANVSSTLTNNPWAVSTPKK